MPLKILVTGFGPSPSARKNPTARLMRALDRQRDRLSRFGIELHAAVQALAAGSDETDEIRVGVQAIDAALDVADRYAATGELPA